MYNKILYFKSMISYENYDNLIAKITNKTINYKSRQLDILHNLYNSKYSYNELLNIYKLNEKTNIYSLIKEISNYFINMNNGIPRVSLDKVLDWQKLVYKMDEDIFTTMAKFQFEIKYKVNTLNRNWEYRCKYDDIIFNSILNSGISENHYHLKGSGPVAQLNFISLMNCQNLNRIFNKNTQTLYENIHTDLNFIKLKEICKICSDIRIYLFNKIYKLKENISSKNCVTIDIVLENIINPTNFNNIQQNILYFKLKNKIDYCNELYDGECNYCTGERALFYYIYKYWSEMNDLEIDLFNLYLIIKNKIFTIFIQSNEKVGFDNFSRYDKIKELFLTKDYEKLLPEYSIKNTITNPNIKNIEYRIAPKMDLDGSIKQIKELDKIISNENIENKHIANHCYVYHFIKSSKEYKYLNSMRNGKARFIAKKQADVIKKTILSFKEKSPIVGIDAANSEFGCRPEVYGPIFRNMRTIASDDYICKLKFTYHVGEDFIDIIDGLRAIEEAILFLGLKNGDRLGHCVAIGINANLYYKFKSKNIVKTCQDALDDYVWMYYKIIEFAIESNGLKEKIYDKIIYLLRKVYGPEVDIYDYYQSMKLRGNYPFRIIDEDTFVNECAYNTSMPNYNMYKENEKAQTLFKRYHYDYHAKKKGSEITEVEIDNTYINVVEQLQLKIAYLIKDMNICIETNPTSNYLIAPLNEFSQIPLFSFNMYGLNDESPNIPTSVCTDDQGIFSTNIETEYALIYTMLTSDEHPYDVTAKYPKDKVIQYMKQLIENSNTFSFYRNKR